MTFFNSINNDLLPVTGRNYYITASLIKISKDYIMNFGTAGHPPILVVPPSGQCLELQTDKPMLGIFPEVDYASQDIQLQSGYRILMYTDCLIEDSDNEPIFPMAEIAKIMQDADVSLDKTIRRIIERRKDYTGSASLSDDLAILCIEIP